MANDISKEAIKVGLLVGVDKAAAWIRETAKHGFESYSLTMGCADGFDFKKIAKEVKEELSKTGAVISSLAVFGNPLGGEPADERVLASWKTCVDAAHLFDCDIVAGFAGRVRSKPIPESMPVFKKKFTPIAKRALDKGVRLAFENCEMGGTWNSGDWNIAHTPAAWDMMFNEIPLSNVGLEWEPCHQLVKLIDPMPQLRQYAKKIFHVHGKDATVHWDVVRKHGINGAHKFAWDRTPGFGDSNWTSIISDLRMAGFKGSIDIEGWHDPVYRGDLEMTGWIHGMNYLKQCRGGNFAPNAVV